MGPGQGRDLRSVLAADGPLGAERAVTIVRQIAAALDDAHANQVIHRDITPATILLADNDYAYLADVGAVTASVDTAALAYRAPELLANTAITYRADVYALACVLYECLTGTPAFPTAGEPADLIDAHLSGPIPYPSEQEHLLPPGFDAVIARGLAKNPDDRYQHAGELAEAARAALDGAGEPAPRQAVTEQSGPQRSELAATRTVLTGTDEPGPRQRAPDVSGSRQAVTEQSGPHQPPHRTLPTVSWQQAEPSPAAPKRRRRRVVIAAAVLAVVAAAGATAAVVVPKFTHNTATDKTPAQHTYTAAAITELPFTDLTYPGLVAVDGSGNVYVLDRQNRSPETDNLYTHRVLKLAPGAASPVTVDVPDVDPVSIAGLAADQAGNLYLTDTFGVWELAAGAARPMRLPFTGTLTCGRVTVGSDGTVYAACRIDQPSTSGQSDYGHGVLKLTRGAAHATELSLPGLYQPTGVAVDAAGNVYVIDQILGKSTARILKLGVNATAPTELPASDFKIPWGLAVDTAGNLFNAGPVVGGKGGVLELAPGGASWTKLPFDPIGSSAVAVDKDGNIYVTVLATTDDTDGTIIEPPRVLKLAADR